MLKRLTILTIFLLGTAAIAQNINGANTRTIRFPGAPTGTCQQFSYAVNNATGDFYDCLAGTWFKIGPTTGGGTISSIATTSPITGGPITTTGTIACPTCAVGPGSSTTGHLATFASTDGLTLADGGAVPTGTITSIATTSPLGGGTITSTGTLTCTTCVVASSPGAGIAHFAGSTQTVTSSAVNLASADVTGILPAANSTYQVLSAQNSTTDTLSCATTTNPQNFATNYTLPANTLTANKLLRITFGWSLTTSSSAATQDATLKIGGVTVYSALVTAPIASQAAVPAGVSFIVQGTAAPGASVAVITNPLSIGPLNGLFAPISGSTTAASQNLATNGTLTIQLSDKCNATTAGNSMTLNQMIVETLN